MRQLLVQVPRGCGKNVLDIAKACDGVNLVRFEATGSDKPLDVVIVHVPNQKVEELLGELESLPELHVTLIPRGIIALEPPASEAPQQVKNVEARSPIEIFLAGLQSVGSWKGFLGYAGWGCSGLDRLVHEYQLSSGRGDADRTVCGTRYEHSDRNSAGRRTLAPTYSLAILRRPCNNNPSDVGALAYPTAGSCNRLHEFHE